MAHTPTGAGAVPSEVVGKMQELPDRAFKAMVESSVSPFVVLDDDGKVSWAGPRVQALLGRPVETVIGQHFLDIIDPASQDAAVGAFVEFVEHANDPKAWIGPPLVIDVLHADGSTIPCEVGASLGAPMGIDGMVLQVRRSRGTPLLYDAVDAMAIGAPIDDVLTRLARLCEHDTPGSAVIVAWGWDGERFRSTTPTLSGNRAETPTLPSLDREGPSPWREAMEAGELRGGDRLRDEYPEIGAEAEAAGFSTCWVLPVAVRESKAPTAALILWRHTHGDALPHRTTTAGRVARLVALAIESDRNVRALREAASTDALTGLPNRATHYDSIVTLLEAKPATTEVSVLFCDLDDFKPVNDKHGHDVGDRVLGIVGERLRATVRSADHVSRWGGDEFLITTTLADPDEVAALARRLIARIEQPIVVDGISIDVGFSIGIACDADPESVDALIQEADDALRTAKELGKSQFVFADSCATRVQRT